MSKGSSRRQLPVTWNPARGVWETDTLSLYCGHAEPFLATWPASGSMRNGVASERTKSVPPTVDAASSSEPGRLLPTPRPQTKGGCDAVEAPPNRQGGPNLATAIALLPTPAASFPGTTANFRPDGTPYSEGYGMTLLDAVRLLPTPRATDGTKGGPNQRGSKGDLMLPSAVSQLLPTPTASATEKSTRALTSSTGNGRRTGGGQSSSLGLTEIAKLATGERPANLPADEDLPPSSRRIVEQFSPFGKENPTLTGAITDPPSDGGNESSDDEPPGQLTLLDD